MMPRLIHRFHRLLMSIYLYNEYRGYTQLEKLLGVFKSVFPEEAEMAASITKHLEDEKKHFRMFKGYFLARRSMPYEVGKEAGYIDRLVGNALGCALEDLEAEKILGSREEFFKICRLIMMTEFRGMKQVEALLANRWVKKDPALVKIFSVVKKDEPSHCLPYQAWLEKFESHRPRLKERLADALAHYSLMLYRIPLLFMNFRLKPLERFPA